MLLLRMGQLDLSKTGFPGMCVCVCEASLDSAAVVRMGLFDLSRIGFPGV